MPKIVNTGVKLEEGLHQRLKSLSMMKARSPHWLMKAAIEQYVQREERYEQEKREDLERWERYKLTGQAVTQPAVKVWLSTWGDDGAGEVSPPCPK
ncbi:toxin-antitoxin system [Thiocystis minor]|uniref:CopG family ribbon-helix-helix protein n=1 Tax=Thiocystis minor TaxID=61597 RepID=UPI0019115E30|nr:toxin-antitoxin system [Thiocystis minor]MBK5965575.1 toxin-antitoxin system [Thiocystis minor]